jgi:hypothetical protein
MAAAVALVRDYGIYAASHRLPGESRLLRALLANYAEMC